MASSNGASLPTPTYEDWSSPPPIYSPPQSQNSTSGYKPYQPPQQQVYMPYPPQTNYVTTAGLAPGTVHYTTAGYSNVSGEPTGFVVVTQQVAAAGVQDVVPIRQSFCSHYIMSCLAFWLCFFLFGGIAFILAVFADEKSKKGDAEKVRSLSFTSTLMSTIGFITGIVLWSLLIYYLVVEYSGCYYCFSICYRERDATSLDYCQAYYTGYCWDNGYCYHN